ncbi:antigen peptide transporter 2 [Danio rerio]|uniref:Antigen peptide transporter 2 n=2 Tax=Danio rerio TaxID=7955 RepID=E7F2I0_DANRE|nr:antigen peptide transporter 2-like isoform X1 [Danio rerio]XP_009305024.1 antigen peptide transporter 2-like isoform X1 [Danio rerio]XP_021336011.1 antigen peptide transporter 2-like isoform X1 [Danio rerio]|eukprot:XP_005156356.1 antigen peptide transporter 2-like isoform X1 [Danio rerio]
MDSDQAHVSVSRVVLVHFCLLFCDLLFWACVWAILLWLDGEGSLDLWCLWALRTITFAGLYLLSTLVPESNLKPLLKRWVALLSFLPPVFDSMQILLDGTLRGFNPVPDPGMVILSSATSILIYMVWEMAFPHGGSSKGGRNQKKDEEARALLMRVIRYSRLDYLYLGAAFIFLSLAALFETFIPYCTGKVIDILSGKYQHSNFTWAILLLALCSLGSSMFSGLRGGMFMFSLNRLNKRIRNLLFQNVMKQEIDFFDEIKPGNLASRLISDTDKMGRAVAMNVNVLLRSMVKTCGMLYFMLGVSWQLTLLTCIEMPLLAFLQNSYNSLSQKTSKELQDCNAETGELASSVIGSIKTVRSFKAECQEQQRYEQTINRKLQVLRRKGFYSAVYLLIRRFITVGLKVAMLCQGRNLISSGQLSSGSLLAFVFYQKDMVTSMKHLVYIYGDMLSTVGSSVKVFQLLDRKPQMREAGDLAPEKLKGRITFEKVTFSYLSRPDDTALKSVTLELSPGKLTALVGPSGGGKSSCVSLLQRFYEPKEGEMFLDGEPLYHYQHQYLHKKVAVVSQDPVLFSGSVRYNIEYGLQDCTLERIEEAARKANAHNFICNLEQGYDTDVGECGGQLSAGQKQCIAIARALIRNPQILILDEATSHMDSSTQQAIQDVLNSITDQTVLVIAHRLETIEKADHIIFMEGGEVKEQGTHQQLMDKQGRYHRLREKLFNLETQQAT